MSPKFVATLLLPGLLAACASAETTTRVESTRAPRLAVATVPHRPRRVPLPPPRIQSLPGVEGVIGATSAELERQFGTARLNVWEGDARKLQFTGTACILDVYLYPSAAGAEPKATYVEARRSDGRDVDDAACIGALRQR